ncbi:MAG: hypothetical protein Fur0018_01070 [Anaerolineales bacterium]
MKIFQKSPLINEDGSISFFNRLRGTLQYGNSWYRDVQAQDEIIRALNGILDNRYVLLRNLVLPDAGIPIPLVLVGPTGIWVLYVSGLRGAYRAKEDSWQRMDGGHFRPVRPNLVRTSMLMARALQNYLSRQGLGVVPQVQPALLFSDPAQHVDTQNPAVRVVLSDAIDRFGMSVARQDETLQPPHIDAILTALSHSEDASDRENAPEKDAFSLRDEDESGPRRGVAPTSSSLDAYLKRFHITRKQAMLLGGMFAAEVFILFVFVLLLLFRP